MLHFILKILSLLKIEKTQTSRQHHVCAARLGLPLFSLFSSAIRWNLSFSIETYFVLTFFPVRRSMATLTGDCTGRIIYTREELDTWAQGCPDSERSVVQRGCLQGVLQNTQEI